MPIKLNLTFNVISCKRIFERMCEVVDKMFVYTSGHFE